MEQTRPQFLPQFSEFNPGTQNAPLSRERRGVTLRENQRLTLGELRSLACLLKTSLLTLDDACVTGQVASLLQCGAVVLAVDLVQCTSDTQAQSTCLAGGATTVDACDDVVCALKLEELEGLVDVLLVQLVGEVVVQATAVDGPVAGTGTTRTRATASLRRPTAAPATVRAGRAALAAAGAADSEV